MLERLYIKFGIVSTMPVLYILTVVVSVAVGAHWFTNVIYNSNLIKSKKLNLNFLKRCILSH